MRLSSPLGRRALCSRCCLRKAANWKPAPNKCLSSTPFSTSGHIDTNAWSMNSCRQFGIAGSCIEFSACSPAASSTDLRPPDMRRSPSTARRSDLWSALVPAFVILRHMISECTRYACARRTISGGRGSIRRIRQVREPVRFCLLLRTLRSQRKAKNGQRGINSSVTRHCFLQFRELVRHGTSLRGVGILCCLSSTRGT